MPTDLLVRVTVLYYSYCTVKVIYPLSKICLIVFFGETESWIKPYVFYWMDASENVMVKLASGFESAAFLTAGGKDQLHIYYLIQKNTRKMVGEVHWSAL